MKIGILIPTINRRDYLIQALQSAYNQTHGDLAIIVIDNGSTDGTREFMSGVTDPRVQYIINENNLGMAGSINRGIGLFASDVEWCTVLCDDDVLHRDYVSRMAGFLNDHPGILIASGRIIFTDDDLHERRNAVMGPEVESALSYLVARTDVKRETYLSALIFHRNSFIEIGGYPLFASGLATDDALIFHLAAKGSGLAYNKFAVCYIRIHVNAESVSLPGGFATHFRSAIDFKDYCLSIARRYRLPENTVLNTIDIKIKGFLYVLFTTRYAIHLKFLQGKADNEAFLKMLQEAYLYLPFRIKLDYLCYTAFGIAVERYWPYKILWKVVGMLYLFFRRHMSLHSVRVLTSGKNGG
jgi:glycosyltransferase involved in cell wall biosynthesis